MLRSYLKPDHPLKHLELGSEPTIGQHIENQVRVARLVRDCLADHGTYWLNIGDTYATTGVCGGGSPLDNRTDGKSNKRNPTRQNVRDVQRQTKRETNLSLGNLCLIPWRLAIALQDDGWIVRSVVVWHKPAPMPISVSGWRWMRCRVKVAPKEIHVQGWGSAANNGREGAIQYSYGGVKGNNSATWSDCPGCKKCEPHGGYVLRKGSWRPTNSWEPVLMLAKSANYFCDGEAVKTPAAGATLSRNEYTRVLDDPDEQFAVRHDHESNLTTANLRDVWGIASEALKAAHYAAFPSELAARCLRAGTSAKGYCPKCGKPVVRVVESPFRGEGNPVPYELRPVQGSKMALSGKQWREQQLEEPTQTIGWRPSCSCPEAENPRAGLVLDPFSGSGRTGLAALRLGLDFVGCELNEEYADLSRKLLYEEMPLFSE